MLFPVSANWTLFASRPPVKTQYVVVLLIVSASATTAALNSWLAEERLFIASMPSSGAPSIVTFGHPAGNVMDVALNDALLVSVAAAPAVMIAFVVGPGTAPLDQLEATPRSPLVPPIQTGSLLRMSITDLASAESESTAPAKAGSSGSLILENTLSSNVPSPVMVRSAYAPGAGVALNATSSAPSTSMASALIAPTAPLEYGMLSFAPSLNTTDGASHSGLLPVCFSSVAPLFTVNAPYLICVVEPPKESVPSSTSKPPLLYVVQLRLSLPEPFFVTLPSDSSIRVCQVSV